MPLADKIGDWGSKDETDNRLHHKTYLCLLCAIYDLLGILELTMVSTPNAPDPPPHRQTKEKSSLMRGYHHVIVQMQMVMQDTCKYRS